MVRVSFTDVYGGLAPSGATPATPGLGMAGLLLICIGALAYGAGSTRRDVAESSPAAG